MNDSGTIELSPGRYTGPGNLDIEINGLDLDIIGTATESCILDGEVIDPSFDASRRAFHVGKGSTVTIRGLSFTRFGGRLDGGAVHVTSAEVLIQDCCFDDNVVTDGDSDCDALGAAVLIERSTARIEDSLFRRNEARAIECLDLGAGRGGAIAAIESTVLIEGSDFTGNEAESGGGGAIMAVDCALVRIAGTSLDSNVAQYGGGLQVIGGAALLTDVDVIGNVARDEGFRVEGGGVYAANSSITLIDVEFIDNTAIEATNGVGATLIDTTFDLVNCTFMGNRSRNGTLPVLQGVALHVRGGSGDVVNSTFVANYEQVGLDSNVEGVGLYASRTEMGILDCAFVHNDAQSGNTGDAGGAIFLGIGATVTMRNSIVWDNHASTGPDIMIGTDSARFDVAHSIVDLDRIAMVEGAALTIGDRVLDEAPAFVRAPDPGFNGIWGAGFDDPGDLRPAPGSPAIDAGREADLPADTLDVDEDGDLTEPLPFDRHHLTRRIDDPRVEITTSTLDLGPYEHCPADLNLDGVANIFDVMAYLADFEAGSASADWTRDGSFDMDDLLVFLGAFEAGC